MVTIIDHSKQRHATVGDWHFDKRGNLSVKVSALSDRRYEFLVAAHEMVEAMLCREAGVSERTVDAFDMVYEKHRKRGDDSEPGDDPRAPYRRQHQIATVIERRLARALGVDWVANGREIASK